MILDYLDESFANPLAKESLLRFVQSTFPDIGFRRVKLESLGDCQNLLISEENPEIYIGKEDECRKVFVLVTEFFVQNKYTRRLTRNLNSGSMIELLAHVLAYYLHLLVTFRRVGKLSRWDVLLFPLIPPFLILYLYVRFRRSNSKIKSLVEHEFHLAGVQCSFDRILPRANGLLFAVPSLRASFDKFYTTQKHLSTLYNVFESGFQFKITGRDLFSLNWYGLKNWWRQSRVSEIANQINRSLECHNRAAKLEYKFTSATSPEVFHLVMRQSGTWPMSSPGKIFDILKAGKIPVMEYEFSDHPLCRLSLSVTDLIELYNSKLAESVLIDRLEQTFREKIETYNAWAVAENMSSQTRFMEFIQSPSPKVS